MKYIDLTEEQGGGGGGTSNHAQLSNLNYSNAGHTGFMSSANYLPAGTTITVGSNSADYTSIQDALNFLENKWSDGIVKISLAGETFNTTTKIDLSNNFEGIPVIQIYGTGMNNTIINYTGNVTDWQGVIINPKSNNKLVLQDMTIQYNGGNTFSPSSGFCGVGGSNFNISRVNIKNVNLRGFAIGIRGVAYTCDITNLECENCNSAIDARNGSIINITGTLTGNNVTTYLGVIEGGIITLSEVTKSFTNVSNQTNQTIGTIGTNGMIIGSWS